MPPFPTPWWLRPWPAVILMTAVMIGSRPTNVASQERPEACATNGTAGEATTGRAPAVRLDGRGGWLARLAELRGAAPTRSWAWTTTERQASATVCTSGVLSSWLAPIRGEGVHAAPATLRLTLNSAYPSGRNDGVQWAGRGLSGVVSAGFAGQSGPFAWAVRPQVAWAQNRDFAVYDTTLVDRKPFAYPWHARRIDWPQRFGDGPVTWVHPGESFVRAEMGPVQVGVSTENVQWGPAQVYPLLLSANAPGFPHVSVAFGRPVTLGGFATLDAQILWGVVHESAYFDNDPANDRRLLSGMVVSLQPLALPGLYLGAASLVHTSLEGGLKAGDLASFLQVPVQNANGNVAGNGLGEIFARWVFPEAGFEAYAEWARDDYSLSFQDLLAEPDHSQAYTLGFQQVAPWGESLLRLGGELTHLTSDQAPIPGGRPEYPVFYTHGLLPQGHTNRGQILGAAVGPGSDAQHLSVDVVSQGSLTGFYLDRIRWDEDAYLRYKADTYGHKGHDVELTLGLHHSRHWHGVLLDVDAAAAFRRNRSFVDLRTADPPYSWEKNLHVQVEMSWWPGT